MEDPIRAIQVLKKGLSNEDLLEEMKKLVTEVESKLEEERPKCRVWLCLTT